MDFTNTAIKQMNQLTPKDKDRIFEYLEKRVAPLKNPKTMGKSLKGNLKKFWRFRVGDYRVIANIFEDRLVIQIVQVGHRKEVYH